MKLFAESPLAKPGGLKSRVLSATSEERLIEQVTERENNDSSDAQNSQMGIQENKEKKLVI